MEIDPKYANATKYTDNSYLPFVIYETPIELSKDEIKDIDSIYKEVNQHHIKIEEPSSKHLYKSDIYYFSGVAGIFGIVLNISGYFYNSDLWVYILLTASGLLCLIPAYKAWQKYQNATDKTYILFDRASTLLTMPKHKNEWQHFIIPFPELKATIRSLANKHIILNKELHFFNDYRPFKIFQHLGFLIMGSGTNPPFYAWSFYVWYMDKNRPLPPGDAFDAYRQQDFERRKAEGFPPPLYKSLVPTPEQQSIREGFWKDEDFIPTQEEAYFSIWKGLKSKINEINQNNSP